jgi:hypothetical protein
MKTKTTVVTIAAPAFDMDTTLQQVRIVEASADNVTQGRKAIMATIAANFGEAALRPASQGGINCAAFRQGTKEDTRKEEASRLGMVQGKAGQLASLVKGINAIRHNIWQEYQRAYFGRTEKAKEATAPSKEAAAAKVAQEAAKVAQEAAKLARAQLMIATITKGDVEAAKATLEEAAKEAATAKEAAKEAKEAALNVATQAKQGKASASLADVIQQAIDMATKQERLGVIGLLAEALESL